MSDQDMNDDAESAQTTLSEEERQLLERISDISGRINRFKNASRGGSARLQQSPGSRSWNKLVTPSSPQPGDSTWRSPRVSPYQTNGRGGPRGRATGHRHRTLILNGSGGAGTADRPQTADATSSSADEAGAGAGAGAAQFVSKRDRHMQLINTAVYDKETQARNKAIEQTQKQKMLQRDRRERLKIEKYLARAPHLRPAAASTAAPAILTIEGIRFQVLSGGSKLARIRDDADSPSMITPKQALVGGVTFLRSKNGNLYRAGVVRAKRARMAPKKIDKLCKRFTSTGQCLRGPRCAYIHDSAKVAICRDFLQTGQCRAGGTDGTGCDLSHVASPERCPACVHFLRGQCSNAHCRYTHVRVTPAAPVCRSFATLGFCERGATCPDKHVRECPDYANSGVCRKVRCRLPHVDRAGKMREKQAKSQGVATADGEDADIASDQDVNDELDSSEYEDDEDSDGMEEILVGQGDAAALTGQNDFVHF